MPLQTQLASLISSLGADYKQLRTWITGSGTGNLSTLVTTTKTSLLAAVNELQTDVEWIDQGVSPADYGLLAWNANPGMLIANGYQAAANGTVHVMKFRATKTMTIANIVLAVITAGATLTSGQNFAGIYSSGGTLLGSTADQSTNWASTGVKTMAVTAASGQSLTIATGAYFYVAYFTNASTRPAFLRGGTGFSINGTLSAAAAFFSTANTGATTAMPATLASLASNFTGGATWAAVS